MRLSTGLQVAGTTLISVAIGFVFIPAGLLVGGIAVVAFGVAIEKAERAK